MTKQSKDVRVQLPKDALLRVHLGQSFAEYDKILTEPGIFVPTPTALAAADATRSKCFFVGRRGTGKTAITYYLGQTEKDTLQLHPQVFAFQGISLPLAELKDTRQRPFRSLVCAFRRSLLDETIAYWIRSGRIKPHNLPPGLLKERNYIEDHGFDERFLTFLEDFQSALGRTDDREWLRLMRKAEKDLPQEVDLVRNDVGRHLTILVDRIDESWDGSDQAVILLMALMHACVQLTAATSSVRLKLFLRENIFERVRSTDNEFSRLETSVVSMEWSQELLLEMIERRLNRPFNTKLPLRGPTWDYFFESTDGQSSRSFVFSYCQERPRDVLTYCSFAIEAAQSRKHERVTIEDLQAARRRFSESRLKDLGDEYAENYPQLQIILARFYGLGREYTLSGIGDLIKKLLVDEQVKRHCARWVFQYTNPEQFVGLLFSIGFVGLVDGEETQYRSSGVRSSGPTAISPSTHIVIHPSYVDALSLQNVLISNLDEDLSLRTAGVLEDLPDSIGLAEYTKRLQQLLDDLASLPIGKESAGDYEDLVGEVLRLCFFRSLSNVQPQSRTIDGCVRRDWIASNRASGGFWEIIRQRYQATQVIWECKNHAELGSAEFQQVSYYMTGEIGRFAVVAFRGDVSVHHYNHIKRISSEKNGNACVLLLTDRDLQVFIRQALNGKTKEGHIQDVYDRTVRAIS